MTAVIDLRSDTVTKPSEGMRRAMTEAEVGDDVYGDDPTVNRLEEISAERFGFDAALFTPSGTQANLIAILSHCDRGDEYIVGQQAHTYKYEGGGAAVLGSVQPQPIEFEPDSTLDLQKVAAKIKPDDIHFARTKLLCLENTQNGKPLPLPYLSEAKKLCDTSDLRLHLDGARVINAAIEQQVNITEITTQFDSVSICLSKGLGAPVGSILCGERSFINQARKWRKMAGGGMRQAGILAAAGIYALNNNVNRLVEDHDNASFLAAGLQQHPLLKVENDCSQTNMVFVSMKASLAEALADYLKGDSILISPAKTTRLATHLDVSRKAIEFVLQKVDDFFAHL